MEKRKRKKKGNKGLNITKYEAKALKCLNQTILRHSKAEMKSGYFKSIPNHNLSGFLFSLT